MTAIVDKNSGGTTLVSYGYTYDAASRVTQEARTWASGSSTDTLTYGYTNNDQLTSVATRTAHSRARALLRRQRQPDGHRLHDDHGQRADGVAGLHVHIRRRRQHLTSTQTFTGDVWTYGYNFAGQITERRREDVDGHDPAQATITYDALGRRIGMDENGTQTWTLYDGSQPVIDFTGSGSLGGRKGS